MKKKTRSSTPTNVTDSAGKQPDAVRGNSPGEVGTGTDGKTKGRAGEKSRLVMVGTARTTVDEAIAWATPALTSLFEAAYPEWSKERIQEDVRQEVALNPLTPGLIFFTRKDRASMLASGMTHLQVEINALRQVIKVHDCEGREVEWLERPTKRV